MSQNGNEETSENNHVGPRYSDMFRNMVPPRTKLPSYMVPPPPAKEDTTAVHVEKARAVHGESLDAMERALAATALADQVQPPVSAAPPQAQEEQHLLPARTKVA